MRFHDLRHTTATLLLRSGVPLPHVQRIMRHRGTGTSWPTTSGAPSSRSCRCAACPGGRVLPGFYPRSAPQTTKAATRRFPVRSRGLLSRGDRI
ncbi:tyrosine-type recombinase/integrase [Anaeromyxobacter sp. SG66]|uniref:tyrosine-type recombinase/integrase n=1 Tax=Anaeromyxobacter sp. SG66 TaxID=2925410 RepID=UPI0035AC0304